MDNNFSGPNRQGSSLLAQMELERVEKLLEESILKQEFLQKELDVLESEAHMKSELLKKEIAVLEADIEVSEKNYNRNEKIFKRRIRTLNDEKEVLVEKKNDLEDEIDRLEKHLHRLSSFVNIENSLSMQANSFEEKRMLRSKFLEEGHEESGAALFITYSDYITLLLAVFIILYTANTEVLSQMQESISKSFSSSRIFEEPPVNILKPTNESEKFLIKEQIKDIEDEVVDSLKDLQLGDDVQVAAKKEGLIITLKDKITFNPGDVSLRPESKPVLKKIVNVLKKNKKVKVEVVGHTDNMPIKSDKYPSNWELSTSRASNVVRYFVEEEGLDPAQISAKGSAQYQPVASNDTLAGRASNRRVEIRVMQEK